MAMLQVKIKLRLKFLNLIYRVIEVKFVSPKIKHCKFCNAGL